MIDTVQQNHEIAAVIVSLVSAYSQIKGIRLAEYDAPPTLERRVVLDEQDKDRVGDALKLRSAVPGLAFWDAIMLSMVRYGPRHRLLEAALFHTVPIRYIELSREEVADGAITTALKALPEGRGLGMNSTIRLIDGVLASIPMLDIHCKVSEIADGLVAAVCKRLLNCRWLMFDSGDSYHCYGLALLTQAQTSELQTRALFFTPIVDKNWLAHQALAGSSSLRLGIAPGKPRVPRLRVVVD